MIFSRRRYVFNDTKDRLRFALLPTVLYEYDEPYALRVRRFKRMIWLRFYWNKYVFRRRYNHPCPEAGRWVIYQRRLAGTDTWHDYT